MEDTKVKLFEINYETDGEEVDLPNVIEATLVKMGWTEGEDVDKDDFISIYGADFISNETGWLVNSFSYEIMK